MYCVYGVHNGRQIFTEAAIVHPADYLKYGNRVSSYLSSAQPFTALVDTGATCTMISPSVVQKLGLVPIGKMPFTNFNSVEWHNASLFHVAFEGEKVHADSVDVPDPKPAGRWSKIHVNKQVLKGGELPSGRPFDVLLGMDVLKTGRLEVHSAGYFSFTF